MTALLSSTAIARIWAARPSRRKIRRIPATVTRGPGSSYSVSFTDVGQVRSGVSLVIEDGEVWEVA